MSAADHAGRLQQAGRRLEEISAELTAEGTDDDAAVKLAQEAAQIAADVGAVAADAARAASEAGDSV